MSKVIQMQKPSSGLSAAKRAAIADEYGRVVEQVRPLEARKKVLREQILSWHTGLADDASATERGHDYELAISAKEERRGIKSLDALRKFLGIRKFIEIASVTIKAFESAVGPGDRDKFIVKERTGGRDITPTRKFNSEEAA